MSYCSNCGKELNQDARFCSYCGTSVNPSESNARDCSFKAKANRCPYCGEILKAFQSLCPSCGYEIRETVASKSIQDFSERLIFLESQRQPASLISSIGLSKKDNTDEQINNLIRTYAVPNTKEDVYEFIILASSNINTAVLSTSHPKIAGLTNKAELSAALAKTQSWLAKVEQVYRKAQLSFGTDADFSKIQEIYEDTKNSISKAKKEYEQKENDYWLMHIGFPGSLVLLFALLIILLKHI